MKNKIRKRLVKINAFLKSKRKPSLKNIHHLRLEVKHLEAYLELMTNQNNFHARSEIPNRLGKLFHEAGRLRKSELQIGAMDSITKNNRLSRPILFLERLKSSEKKTNKRLRKKRKVYPSFKIKDFAKTSGGQIILSYMATVFGRACLVHPGFINSGCHF